MEKSSENQSDAPPRGFFQNDVGSAGGGIWTCHLVEISPVFPIDIDISKNSVAKLA